MLSSTFYTDTTTGAIKTVENIMKNPTIDRDTFNFYLSILIRHTGGLGTYVNNMSNIIAQFQ